MSISASSWRINFGVAGFPILALVQLRSIFAGPDIIGGGAVSESGGGDASATIDGDPSSGSAIDLRFSGGWWQYDFGSAVSVREFTLLYTAGSSSPVKPAEVSLQWFDGLVWQTAIEYTGLSLIDDVTATFSIYELIVQGGFAFGESPINISLADSTTQQVLGAHKLDPSGTTSVLVPSPGPYDVTIERAGHRPLVAPNHLASEA